MAKSAYAACAGTATLENGTTVEVKYLDAAKIRAIFGKQPPLGPNRKRIGWYWVPQFAYSTPETRDAVIRGPYTSSTKALKAAIEANRKPEP